MREVEYIYMYKHQGILNKPLFHLALIEPTRNLTHLGSLAPSIGLLPDAAGIPLVDINLLNPLTPSIYPFGGDKICLAPLTFENPHRSTFLPIPEMETLPKPRENSRIEPMSGDVAMDAELAQAIMARRFFPTVITMEAWEGYKFANQEIRILESTDCYGAVLWPSAIVLCYFLDTNRSKYNLMDKNIIELGAGTGLVTILASMLGADVISTDMPHVLGNLQNNIRRNTKDRCKHTPKVTELCWGQELEQRFPRSSCRFDYILAADVVYAHPYLTELLDTFDHLCQDGTEILWAMRFRLDPENSFVERFQSRFHLEELYDLPSLSIKLYRAWKKVRVGSKGVAS